MRLLPAAGHRRAPWKNGLGVSRVIAEDTAGAGFDTLRWQVSATEIAADCPFSALPGLDRLFAVIDGEGVELASEDERGVTSVARIVVGGPAHAFRGDWTTHCRLAGGPVRVLNVIVRRGAATAALQREPAMPAGPTDGIVVVVDPSTLDAWIATDGEALERVAVRDPWIARVRAT